MSKVAIIGGGAWGTALACVASRADHDARLWCRSEAIADEVNAEKRNSTYLGDLPLEDISATTDLSWALGNASVILLCVPAQSLLKTLQLFPAISPDAILVSTCKGIDRETGKLSAETVADHFPGNPVAALSGPSFASDVVKSLPTAVTIAGSTLGVADIVSSELSSSTFRCYASDDLRGVELGGALKNVLALAVGAARGMALGASAEAALIARGFAEISRLTVALGGEAKTLMGLSGLGDITLTCSSPQSRNFTYGMALGRGDSLDGLKLAEGAFTAAIALKLAKEAEIDVPITSAIVNVLEKRVTAREAVHQLLTRPLKRENTPS